MPLFRWKKSGINDRGAAIFQEKNWQSLRLGNKTLFMHCGSAPFAQETGGLERMRGKEVCRVDGTAETKFILCFPLLAMWADTVPEVLTLSKPCQMLWDMREMPHGFVFELPIGKEVWTAGEKLTANQEVGLAFDVVYKDYLVAQFERKNVSQMKLKSLDGVEWF